jgi:hypothetical protein
MTGVRGPGSQGASPRLPSDARDRLRRLWDEHRTDAFPAADTDDPRLQEVALYESWLGGIVEAALASGGRVAAGHRWMLEARREEGNTALWSLAAELGDPVRSYVARLMAIEDLLRTLPADR